MADRPIAGANSDPARDAGMAIGATVVALTSQRLQSGNNVEFDMAPLHSGEDKARWRRGPDMLTAAPRGRLAHPCHIPETATDMLRFKAA